MDNRTVEEIRENETMLITEIKRLEKKNKKLKKALKEGVIATCETCEEFGICPHSYREYDYKNEVENLKNQQKEFIEYLEKEIQGQEDYAVSLGLTIDYGIAEYTSGKIDALKESLSKYKEIIGVKDE